MRTLGSVLLKRAQLGRMLQEQAMVEAGVVVDGDVVPEPEPDEPTDES